MWLVYIQAYYTKGDFSIKKQIRGTNPLKIPTNDLVKLAEFPLTNKFFEFDNEINRSLALLLGLTLVLHTPVFMIIAKTDHDHRYYHFYRCLCNNI